MKRLFALVVAAVFSTCLHARWGTSILHLRIEHRAPFVAWFNGWQMHSASNQITIDEVRPGRYQLKVAVPHRLPGGQTSRIIFNDFIQVMPNRVTYAFIDRFGNFVVERSFARYNTSRFQNNTCCANCQEFFDESGYCEHYEIPGFSQHTDVFWQPVICDFHPYGQPPGYVIDGVAFRQLIEAMNASAFESTKLQVLKQAASHYYFTTAQVADVLKIFSFETTRLEAAKLLYPKTIDKQNFFNVSGVFNFSSSIDDLTRYIAQR
jgi:hypothetical protein